MLKQGKFKLLSLLVVLGLLLAACSSGDETGGKKDPGKDDGDKGGEEVVTVDPTTFPQTVVNDETEIDGGTLNYALVSSSPFEGTLDWNWYSGAPDAEVLGFFSESIFGYDTSYQITNDEESAAKYELSEDYKTLTVKIEPGVKWHDGHELTTEDYAFSFEVIGHPDYTGVRYGDALISEIVGMKEYHEGTADTISGINIIDDYNMTITWNEPNASVLSGVWAYATPKHHFEGVSVAEMLESPKTHTDVIGFGPFKVKNIVPGESVEFEAFEDYYGGTPKLDKVVLKVVNPSTVVEEINAGKVDIASFPTDQYQVGMEKELTNYQLLAYEDNAYTYIGFKLGHWDAEKGEAVMDENMKMADVKLRQAMGYAMNNEAVAQQFYKGLRVPAKSMMIPFFKDYHNPDIEGYSYNPEKAKSLLDEAGYKDTDDDGFRETPDGEQLVINFASMEGGETAEPLARFYIQNWEEVGLKVELVDGRLHEFNSFYDMVELDDPKVDIYQGAWGTGTDPDPYGLYSKYAPYNYPRYVSDKNEELLEKGHSLEALDIEFRKDIYNQWQELMVEDVPVVPTLYRYALTAVNNRVKNYSEDVESDFGREDWALTADKAYVAE